MYSSHAFLWTLALLFGQQIVLLEAGYGLGVPLCQGCRVRYVKYPLAGAIPIINMERYKKPVPKSITIERVINHYKKIDENQIKRRTTTVRSRISSDYSFIVKIQFGSVSQCSGALLSLKLVLSSSSCFRSFSASKLDKLHVLISHGQRLAVASVQQPASYDEITLLILKSSPINVKPVTICNTPLQPSMIAIMLMASDDLSFYGRRSTQLISNRSCKTSYVEDEQAFITSNMQCLRNSLNPDHCGTIKGDALLQGGKLCGLSAYGSRCRARTTNADLYVNLYKMKQFLTDAIQKAQN
ncbi:uncharacterized protein LOC115621945 [Scaptodrosophila lebanonensis]|uniref:Uncharacterized protein LOC115621945 n=1 Tax=Drosophila lebanonensis TaxID=7225 RepID=A0A6J2T9M7_DROLE|nr:uncharacterized protein LOC115621945 [Scaptodrosophila lebanonensis]